LQIHVGDIPLQLQFRDLGDGLRPGIRSLLLCFRRGAGAKFILGGSQLRLAAAEAKATLLSLAATRLGVPAEALIATQGVISLRNDAKQKVSYAELLGGLSFNREITGKIKPKSSSDYKLVGKSVPRVDIPEKVTGEHIYLQNLRLPSMLHGRVIRPATVGAKLVRIDEASIKAIAGVVKVVAKGNFVGVVCETLQANEPSNAAVNASVDGGADTKRRSVRASMGSSR
jgi:CO/xanthine dehydrogenase Mo-binding subunit